MSNRKSLRVFGSGLAAGALAIAAIGGVAAAVAADAPEVEEAYNGVDGFAENPPAPDAMAEQIDGAVTEFFEGPSSSESVPTAELEQVNVVLTFAAWSPDANSVVISGYVPVLDPGSCIAQLTSSAGDVVTESAAAIVDATTMGCPDFSIPLDKLAPGKWQVALGFESAKYIGASLPVEVTIP